MAQLNGAEPNISYADEVARKGIHLTSAICPLLYLIPAMSRDLALLIGVPAMLLMVAIDVSRQTHGGFRKLYDRYLGRVMRAHEQDRLCGATWVMIGVVLCIASYTKPVAVAAMFFLSISDSLASLVGRKVGGPGWFGKTLAGSAAFFVSALVIALLCLHGQPLAALAGALLATIVEAVPLRLGRTKLDDNLLVPVVGGATMTLVLRLLPA